MVHPYFPLHGGGYPPPPPRPTPHWAKVTGLLAGSILAARLYCRYSVGECSCRTDLTGKTVVITGGNSGIGKATALELARRNAKIIIGCPNAELGEEAVKEIQAATGNHEVTFKPLDLSSFESVRKFSENVKETAEGLHILINNSGITGTGGKRLVTDDGCERVMQTNYLGHFLLTLSVAELMVKSGPSRIINVASENYKWAKLDLGDITSWKKYNDVDAYDKSKLAVVLFTTELSKRLQGTGVTVNAVHPGIVKTDIVKQLAPIPRYITKALHLFIGKTPSEGAQTTLHLALSPGLEKVSGHFFKDCRPQKLAKTARNEGLAEKLFRLSEDIVQFKVVY